MKKIISVIFAFVFILCAVLPVFAAEPGALRELSAPNGGVIGVCARGLWHEYPENSLEGVIAAGETGIDFVLVDVQRTRDGSFILFRDTTTKRMIPGEDRNIAELDAQELLSMKLKNRAGGSGESVSEYSPALLEDALNAASECGSSLMINVDVTLLNGLCTFLSETGASKEVVLLVNAKTDAIKVAVNGIEDVPFIIGVKRGNVIFDVNSYVKKASESGFAGVVLKTTNRYGVNFHQSVLKNFNGEMRAVADLTEPKLAGAREDSEKWWNDLISRGYSVIITNFPELFVDYLERTDSAKTQLDELYKKYTSEWRLPEFKSNIFNDYKKAYTDAVTQAEKLFADGSVSLQDVNDCMTALVKAVDDINANYEALENGSAGMTVSLPRILLCVGAVAAVVAVQIFFWKKRKEV